MKIRQWIAGMLTLTLCAGLLTGCKSESSVQDDVSVITAWSHNSHSRDTIMPLIEEFNSTTGKEMHIKIEYSIFSSSVDFKEHLENGTAPDFLELENLFPYIKSGYLLALEDLPGGAEYVATFGDSLIENAQTYQGKTYQVPIAVVTLGLAYNKDLFRKAGIVDENGEPTPPKTFAEVREYAKRISALDARTFGIVLPMKWNNWFWTDVLSCSMQELGHRGFDSHTNSYDYSKIKPVLEMYMGIKEDGSYFPGAESLDNDQARAQFAEGRIGMKFAGVWDVGVLNDQFPAKCDWGVARLPVSSLPYQYAQFAESTNSFCINAKSINRVSGEKLMTVFKFLTSDELLKAQHETGKAIPYDIAEEDLQKEYTKTGWGEFIQATQYSTPLPYEPVFSMPEGTDTQSVFLREVWTGKMSIDDFIMQMNTAYNARYQELIANGKLDPDLYYDPDYDATLSE